MRVIEPARYRGKQYRHHPQNRRGRRLVGIVSIFLVAIYLGLAFRIPIEYTPSQVTTQRVDAEQITLPWPSVGSAAISYKDSGKDILASYNGTAMLPTASTIKLLTVLVTLDEKPLIESSGGEQIVISASDVERTEQIASIGGSYFPVNEGDILTYNQAIEATLIASSNNIAEIMTNWVFGSQELYKQSATDYLRRNGLSSTTVDDSSGLSALTVSSAEDMAKIAELALSSETIRSVTSVSATQINSVSILNTNVLLSKAGFNGLKTGYTPEAGGCLLLSKSFTVDGVARTAYVAVLGQNDRNSSFIVAESLIASVESNFHKVEVVSAEKEVARLTSPWGSETPVVAQSALTGYRWRGEEIQPFVEVESSDHAKKGDNVGYVELADQRASLVLSEDLPKPSIWWRLAHAVDFGD